MKPPYFLNVDLLIESRSPLTSLAIEFGDRVSVLFSGRMKGRHCLYVDSAGADRNQDAILRTLCALIEGLSAGGKRVWNAATIREFDLGYETRLSDRRSNRIGIRPSTLRRVAALGATLAVTLYGEPKKRKALHAK
jgi:hypothetical protein